LNQQARSMVTGQMRTIGLALADMRSPHMVSLMRGANRVALEQGYGLLIIDMHERDNQERELLEIFSGRVDGFIASARLSEDALNWLCAQDKPAVFFGYHEYPGVHTVRTDGFQAAYLMGRHLVEAGYQSVAYIGYPASRFSEERSAGLSAALIEAGLCLASHVVDAPTMEEGKRIATAVLQSGSRPDAVVAFSDPLAIGLMHAALSIGIKLPEDVAIAGFDDIPAAAFMSPALTTVNMRAEEQGEAALRLMLESLRASAVEFQDIMLVPQLMVRGSTARSQTQK
jgi:DNA-binding LacI/PurR family transcriptional regulator